MTHSQPHSEPGATTELRSPADIPGLGPIRVRALQKAGLGDLATLRGASLETLESVPGMSKVKALHIQEYLRAHETAPEVEAPSARAAPRALSAPPPSTPDLSIVSDGQQAVADAVALFRSEQAHLFRGRLLRELSRFAWSALVLVKAGATLEPWDVASARRCFQSASRDITAAMRGTDLDRKAQSRLARRLAGASKLLRQLDGSVRHEDGAVEN